MKHAECKLYLSKAMSLTCSIDLLCENISYTTWMINKRALNISTFAFCKIRCTFPHLIAKFELMDSSAVCALLNFYVSRWRFLFVRNFSMWSHAPSKKAFYIFSLVLIGIICLYIYPLPLSHTHAHQRKERGRRKLSHNWTTTDASYVCVS